MNRIARMEPQRRDDIFKKRRRGWASLTRSRRRISGSAGYFNSFSRLGEFIAALRTRCHQILGTDKTWELSVEGGKPDNVLFSYPSSATPHEYVRSQVVLELGTHAEFIPHGTFAIQSFVAEEFPKLVEEEAEVSVEVLLAKRTFWEKATILHAEFHRPAEKPPPTLLTPLLRPCHDGHIEDS